MLTLTTKPESSLNEVLEIQLLMGASHLCSRHSKECGDQALGSRKTARLAKPSRLAHSSKRDRPHTAP
jgi:hypothetical protein